MSWPANKDKILANLSRVIPPPAPKVAKRQKRFAGLKPGDRVQHNETLGVLTIKSVDSLGAVGQYGIFGVQISTTLERDWPDNYTKLKKPRKKKEKPCPP